MPRLPKGVAKPKRVAPAPKWIRSAKRYWDLIPPSNHGVWSIARLGILGGVLYANASNFDITEGRTLITMTLLEVAGLKRRS